MSDLYVSQVNEAILLDTIVRYRNTMLPWHIAVGGPSVCIQDENGKLIAEFLTGHEQALFIVQTINLVPSLVKEIMRLRWRLSLKTHAEASWESNEESVGDTKMKSVPGE